MEEINGREKIKEPLGVKGNQKETKESRGKRKAASRSVTKEDMINCTQIPDSSTEDLGLCGSAL